jgi:hypothetical protein
MEIMGNIRKTMQWVQHMKQLVHLMIHKHTASKAVEGSTGVTTHLLCRLRFATVVAAGAPLCWREMGYNRRC